MNKMKVIIKLLFIAIYSIIAGCCSCPDPLERLNRPIFKFNMALDRAIFRPVAHAYDTLPPWITCHVGNFFDNIDDVTNVANNTLQFKFLDAWSDLWRLAFNTTVGVLGLFDVASCIGLPKHHQDFGLTLARYGFVNSCYIMIPIFGPSTIRDTIGWTVDWRYLSVWPYIKSPYLRYGLYGLRLVHKRACLLAADKLIDDALDPYIFVRDAYLQKRAAEIRCICPPSVDAPGPDAPKGVDHDPNDPFVADGSENSAGEIDANDPFVPEGTLGESPKDPNDPFVADEGNKPTQPSKSKKSAAAAGDPFVAQ